MCQQLVIARVGQAQAMQASSNAKQNLLAAQNDRQAALNELATTHKLLSTAESDLKQVRQQLAASTRELGESGMQRFELSQTLQDAQTQLAAQLELNGKLQARAKKYRASHNGLCKQVEAAKAESAASRQQLAESTGTLQQELGHTQEQLRARTAELSQTSEAQAALQQQLLQVQDDKQQVRTCNLQNIHHCLCTIPESVTPSGRLGLASSRANTVQTRRQPVML